MTREDVLTLARQAWAETGEGWVAPGWFDDRAKSFERFAELVEAAEREACALFLEDAASRLFAGRSRVNQFDRHMAEVLVDKAKAIRARGQK